MPSDAPRSATGAALSSYLKSLRLLSPDAKHFFIRNCNKFFWRAFWIRRAGLVKLVLRVLLLVEDRTADW